MDISYLKSTVLQLKMYQVCSLKVKKQRTEVLMQCIKLTSNGHGQSDPGTGYVNMKECGLQSCR